MKKGEFTSMSYDLVDPSLRDKEDSGFQPGLTCHIEIDNETGKTMKETRALTAEALRSLAAQIEAGGLEDGFHSVKLPDGAEVGEVYLDHHLTTHF